MKNEQKNWGIADLLDYDYFLYLDEKDRGLIDGKQVVLVDDVISTGSTLKGMQHVVDEAGGHINQIAAVFTEGNADWSDIVALGNLPVFVE